MVLPNCSRTLAYSTAISRLAQATPTASAEARMRNTVRRAARSAAQHPVLADRHAAQRHRSDAAGGVESLQRRDRDAVGRGVDDHDVVTGDQHQHLGIGCAEHRGAFPCDVEVRADDHAPGQSERADCRAVGQSRKQFGAKRNRTRSGRSPARPPRSAETVPGSTRGRGPPGQPPARRARTPNRRAPRRWRGPASPARRPPSRRSGVRPSAVERGAGGRPARQPRQLADRRIREILVFVGDC